MESSATLQERVQSLRLPDRAASVQPFPIVPWAGCFLFALLAGVLGYLAFSAPRAAVGAHLTA